MLCSNDDLAELVEISKEEMVNFLLTPSRKSQNKHYVGKIIMQFMELQIFLVGKFRI